jgi:hypothetical protein
VYSKILLLTHINFRLDTLETKCLAIMALLPMVESPSRDLLRREASSSSGICDSDRRRVSCTGSRPPVESVADALRWGPEQKSTHFFKRHPDVSGKLRQICVHVIKLIYWRLKYVFWHEGRNWNKTSGLSGFHPVGIPHYHGKGIGKLKTSKAMLAIAWILADYALSDRVS